MVLLVGLGNPGKKYENNRHNVGFMFIEHFLKTQHFEGELKYEKKLEAEVGKINFKGKDLVVLEPQTYMNLSGESVQKTMAYYKVPLDNVFVAHDDLDIPFGKFKIQKGVGPKLHNGISSIENKLGTPEFYRIRIGVENRGGAQISGEAYVLQDFSPEESQKLTEIFNSSIAQLERVLL